MAVTNVISVLQERFNSQTWTGKPSALWFSAAWPKTGSTWVSYPLVFFRHDGTPHHPLFVRSVLQHWRFTLTAVAESPQGAEAIYNGVMFDGADPEAGTGYGFWRPNSVTVPTGYTFKHLVPTDPLVIAPKDDQPGPSGASLVFATWGVELFVHRTSFT